MDHMRISGTEPSSLILIKNKVVNKWLKVDALKVPKIQAEAKSDGVINPKNYNFNQFSTENFDVLQTLQINRSRL